MEILQRLVRQESTGATKYYPARIGAWATFFIRRLGTFCWFSFYVARLRSRMGLCVCHPGNASLQGCVDGRQGLDLLGLDNFLQINRDGLRWLFDRRPWTKSIKLK